MPPPHKNISQHALGGNRSTEHCPPILIELISKIADGNFLTVQYDVWGIYMRNRESSDGPVLGWATLYLNVLTKQHFFYQIFDDYNLVINIFKST